METGSNFRGSRLIVGLLVNLFTLVANATSLIEGEDYNYGNGRGSPVAEGVAGYAHKDDALNRFTKRREKAIRELYTEFGEEKYLPEDLEGVIKADYDVVAMDSRYASGSGEKVKFLTGSGLEKCQVFLIYQKFYHYDDSCALVPYNSGNAVLDGVTGDIIVMDQQGNIFIHPKEMGFIHHSSFFSQKPIAFGAMVRIKDGEIVRKDLERDNLESVTLFPTRIPSFDWLDGLFYYSGHYDPSSGSVEVKNQIKQDALSNFKKEITNSYIGFEFMVDSYNQENMMWIARIKHLEKHYPNLENAVISNPPQISCRLCPDHNDTNSYMFEWAVPYNLSFGIAGPLPLPDGDGIYTFKWYLRCDKKDVEGYAKKAADRYRAALSEFPYIEKMMETLASKGTPHPRYGDFKEFFERILQIQASCELKMIPYSIHENRTRGSDCPIF